MKINGHAIKPGNVIQHEGGLWVAVKAAHVKPGKGGAFAQVELKNLIDGRKLNERFRSSDTVERVTLEQKDHQYLYAQGDMLVFMDVKTYDQIELNADFVGEERAQYLQDGMTVVLEFYEERPIGIELPDTVVLGDRRGRRGGEGPDGVVVLQARQGFERHAHPDPALHGDR